MRTKLIKCPRCNGRGWVRIGSAYLLAGIPILIDIWCSWVGICDPQDEATKDFCPRCDGSRYIRVRV